MNRQSSAVEECRQALDACPHEGGTVRVMCRVCIGRGEIFAYDMFLGAFLLVDCPRCGGAGADVPEVCPCLERFSRETIAQGTGTDSDEEEGQDNVLGPLSEAMKWISSDDRPDASVPSPGATEELANLQRWAEEHREVKIPHPKASLILHLLDHNMIEFVTIPETGKVELRAKGAKEEFCRFIAKLKQQYSHDELTIMELLNFAYGLTAWEFDAGLLSGYGRGNDLTEINTEGYDLVSDCGCLRGDPGQIEALIREVYGCADHW